MIKFEHVKLCKKVFGNIIRYIYSFDGVIKILLNMMLLQINPTTSILIGIIHCISMIKDVVVIFREDGICLVGLNRSETTTMRMNNAARHSGFKFWIQLPRNSVMRGN